MILPNPKDAVHKAWLYRVLTEFCDNQIISKSLYFKGGTCAAMQGLLDRFSVDLDFDYVAPREDLPVVRNEMEKIFARLSMNIKDKSNKVPQYFLKYPVETKDQRNTIKIDVTMPPPEANTYESTRLTEIDRIYHCQTIETMFANKLVAMIERYEKNESIAGRDLYDIHYFFLAGYGYNADVIKERRAISELNIFLTELISFIESHITGTVITQDLNMLLSYDYWDFLRNYLVLTLNDKK